jgi:hypothetical protein
MCPIAAVRKLRCDESSGKLIKLEDIEFMMVVTEVEKKLHVLSFFVLFCFFAVIIGVPVLDLS